MLAPSSVPFGGTPPTRQSNPPPDMITANAAHQPPTQAPSRSLRRAPPTVVLALLAGELGAGVLRRHLPRHALPQVIGVVAAGRGAGGDRPLLLPLALVAGEAVG
jgi:hypothetical protein